MDIINKFNKHEFLSGVSSAKAIAIAFMPFGFTLGLISKSSGTSTAIAMSMSFIIYSGASQTLLLQLFSGNFEIISAIFAATALNFRYILINLPMFKSLEGTDRATKCIVSLTFTDETVAFLSIKRNKSFSYALGINLVGYLSFCLSAVFGVILGKVVPEIIINSMRFTLYGTFLSLMISSLIIEFKTIRIIMLTAILKLIFIYIYPFNLINDSMKIVVILFLTSLIYAIFSVRSDKK